MGYGNNGGAVSVGVPISEFDAYKAENVQLYTFPKQGAEVNDTERLMRALTYCYENNKQLVITDDITLDGCITPPANATIIFINNPTVNILHGAGITDATWDDYHLNSVFNLVNDNITMKGSFSFNYPNQVNSDLVVAYPPAISVNAQVIHLDTINFGNAYIGLDARRSHGYVFIERLTGFPLMYGVRMGSNWVEDYINYINFRSSFYPGTPTTELRTFISKNATVLEIGRTSWLTCQSVMAYGYKKGIYGYYQAQDDLKEITRAGAIETARFVSIGFDAVKQGIELSPGCYGVVVDNYFSAPIGVDTTDTDCFALKATSNDTYTESDIHIKTMRVWGGGAKSDAIWLDGIDKAVIDDLNIINFGSGAAVDNIRYGVYAKNCKILKINNVNIDMATRQYIHGIYIDTCDDVKIKNLTVERANYSSNRAVRITTNCTGVEIDTATFKDCVSYGIQDDSKIAMLKNITDPNYIYAGTCDTKDGSGNLIFSNGMPLVFTYNGVLSFFTGLSPAYNGKEVTIIFNAATRMDSGGTINSPLFGDITIGTRITFKNLGGTWYETSRYVPVA